MTTRKRSNGFTLVEILIVVVILGILAAIVIPQFTNASQSAKASSLISQLQTIRSQLELFQIQHNGDYPTVDSTWAIMTSNSTALETGPGAGTANSKYGPYLQQAPVNPFSNLATVAADNSAAWQYVAASGSIKAVLPATITAADATEMGLDIVNDVVVTAG